MKIYSLAVIWLLAEPLLETWLATISDIVCDSIL